MLISIENCQKKKKEWNRNIKEKDITIDLNEKLKQY